MATLPLIGASRLHSLSQFAVSHAHDRGISSEGSLSRIAQRLTSSAAKRPTSSTSATLCAQNMDTKITFVTVLLLLACWEAPAAVVLHEPSARPSALAGGLKRDPNYRELM